MTLTGTAVLDNFIPEVAVCATCHLSLEIFPMPTRLWTPWAWICAKKAERAWHDNPCHLGEKRRASHDNQQALEIKTPEDMKGLKMRVMEQPVYIEMMKALGASPTPMAMSELYTALASVIDGRENLPGAHCYQAFYSTKYISLTGHTYALRAAACLSHLMEKLTPEQQQIVRQAALDTRDWQRRLCRNLKGAAAQDH